MGFDTMISCVHDPRPPSGHTKSLILRAWVEPVGGGRLRVRVVEISPCQAERSEIVTASVDETCRTVRAWLEALLARDGSNPQP